MACCSNLEKKRREGDARRKKESTAGTTKEDGITEGGDLMIAGA